VLTKNLRRFAFLVSIIYIPVFLSLVIFCFLYMLFFLSRAMVWLVLTVTIWVCIAYGVGWFVLRQVSAAGKAGPRHSSEEKGLSGRLERAEDTMYCMDFLGCLEREELERRRIPGACK